MPRTLRQLRADPRRAGFVIARQRGSHQTWVYPEAAEASVTSPGADGDDAGLCQERDIRDAIERARQSGGDD